MSTMPPSDTQRDDALLKLAAVTEEALSARGNSHAQRVAIDRIISFAARASVAPLDWMEWYFSKKSTTEEVYCEGCKVTFKNLNAYNGHRPTKCRLNSMRPQT